VPLLHMFGFEFLQLGSAEMKDDLALSKFAVSL
jgi:hypothetical protein